MQVNAGVNSAIWKPLLEELDRLEQEATLQILSSTCICEAQRALDKASNRRIPDRSPSDKVLRRHSFIAPARSITYGKWSVVHRSRIVGIAKICSNRSARIGALYYSSAEFNQKITLHVASSLPYTHHHDLQTTQAPISNNQFWWHSKYCFEFNFKLFLIF